MVNSIKNLAVYTTIYQGVEPFLSYWYRSVMAQTDRKFQLWVGLDELDPSLVQKAIGSQIKATWVKGVKGDTPAQIRQGALEQIIKICDGVVMVDSDDLMHPSRVAEARALLEKSDLAGCALRLVDEKGRDLDLTLSLPNRMKPEEILPRKNVFGLSNVSYRSDILRQCLPIPPEAVLVDWFLATKAWLLGARLSFDPIVRMDYRQHGANMVRVTPPFSVEQVSMDTKRVREHFRIIGEMPNQGFIPERLAELEGAADDVDRFYRRVVREPRRLERYVNALKNIKMEPIWWSWVAHPALSEMWSKERTGI